MNHLDDIEMIKTDEPIVSDPVEHSADMPVDSGTVRFTSAGNSDSGTVRFTSVGNSDSGTVRFTSTGGSDSGTVRFTSTESSDSKKEPPDNPTSPGKFGFFSSEPEEAIDAKPTSRRKIFSVKSALFRGDGSNRTRMKPKRPAVSDVSWDQPNDPKTDELSLSDYKRT